MIFPHFLWQKTTMHLKISTFVAAALVLPSGSCQV